MKNILMFLLLLPAFLAVGCATPHVVQESKLSDKNLDCEDLEDEIVRAEKFEEKARDEKGVTGTNAAAVIFFWPALIATYANAGEAIDAAQERIVHLQKLHRKKDC